MYATTICLFVSGAPYLIKYINICLHFLGFNFIPRSWAKSKISLTNNGSTLGEYRGIISRADRGVIDKFNSAKPFFKYGIYKYANQ